MSNLLSVGLIRSVVVMFLGGLVSFAFAGTLEAPPFQAGQFVYRIPADFVPDKLSEDGLREIQRTAKGLHYPLYVVLVKDLPTRTGASTDDDTERAIVGLADDWARNPRFQRNRATLFLLSYGPGDRKYKMMPAPLWRTELGLEQDALRPFTDIFRNNARRNPQSAITGMMLAFDTHVFEHFDPGQKARRAAQIRQQQETMRLDMERRRALQQVFDTQAGLRNAVTRLARVLQDDPRHLPKDLDTFRSNLSQAHGMQGGDRIEAMRNWTGQLNRDAEELERYAARSRAELAVQQTQRNNLLGGFLLGFGVLAAALSLRWRGLHADRAKVRERVVTWRDWITQARQRYYLFDENRERAPHLRAFTGRTAELYQATSREIDAIIVGVEAVAALLDSVEAKVKRATFFNRKPLSEALAELDKPFRFATDRISEKLFERVEATVEVMPADFLADLSNRYDAAVRDWQALNDSVTRSFELPDALFPHAGLDNLLEKAGQEGIPDRWLAAHPLMGDADADRNLYDRINESRLTDPYAYALQIDELKAREATISHDLDRLIAAVALAQSKQIEDIAGLEGTRLPPEDDPQITLDTAKLQHRKVAEALMAEKAVDAVEAQAAKANELYEKAAAQIAAARQAMILAPLLLKQASAASAEARRLEGRATVRAQQVARAHTDVSSVEGARHAAARYMDSGARDLARAETKFQEGRHLGAQRDAEQALNQFAQATTQLNVMLDQCAHLDAMKARYEQRLAEMARLQGDARSRLRRYNGSMHLINDFRAPSQGMGPADFGFLLGMLQQQEDEWNAAVRHAEREYEEEQRRQREAEEEERRRRQESLFSSSSSSSSFDHSSSFSSSSSDSGSSGGSFSSSSDSGSQGGSW
jgi:hypothetical protein